ncbi:MAG: hypothetical protein AB8B48_15690 [Pseudomonadales bacterium]
MSEIGSRSTRTRYIAFTALLLTVFTSACGSDTPAKTAVSASDVQATATAPTDATTSNAKLWEGEAAGYISQQAPANSDVDFLISLGRVLAAIGRASHYDKEAGMSNPFTPEVLAAYSAIDSFVSGKSSASLSLQPLLSEVASPESFAIIVDDDRSKRMQQNAIQTQLTTLIGRVDSIITERFPSTKTSALAMSALHREAGELLVTGLSEDGQILNVSQYRDALRLMEASFRLRVKKVSSCARGQQAIDQLKDRGPLGDLLDRMIVMSESGRLNGNAGDVFSAAKMLETLGKDLPDDDSKIC